MNHIYIIEDDSVLCSELALALEAVGYHTTCANDFNNVLDEFLLVCLLYTSPRPRDS